MNNSPAAILYDANGVPLAAADGATSPDIGIPVGGNDGDGKFRLLKTLNDGTLTVSTTIIPTDLSRVVNEYVTNNGSPDLLVDGDSTPVEFTLLADSTYDTYILMLKFVIVCTDTKFGKEAFLDKLNPLDNGVLVQIRSNNVTTDIQNIKQSEDFLVFGCETSLDRNGTKDVLTTTLNLGGAKLVAGSGDFVKVTIRDDVRDSGNEYMRMNCKGYRV